MKRMHTWIGCGAVWMLSALAATAQPGGQRPGGWSGGPEVGAPAPDFTLRLAGSEKTLRLSDRTGKKPVVLFFGNFTCGPFCRGSGDVEAIYQRHKDDAEFIFVYVREAHPAEDSKNAPGRPRGGRQEPGGGGFGALPQPKTDAERHKAAETAVKSLGLTMTTVVDVIADTVNRLYSASPDRLYVIDRDGKIAYKSERGPWGFKPEEMEKALKGLLEKERATAKPSPSTGAPSAKSAGLKLAPTTTVADGTESFRFTYRADDTSTPIEGVLTKPAGKGPFPAVVVNHGGGGNADRFNRHAGVHFARNGYVVIACDLTHAALGSPAADRRSFAGSRENADRIAACAAILERLPYADASRVGIYGHSMGAFATVAACTQTDRFKAAAISAGGLRPHGALDTEENVAGITAPFLILHGTADRTVNPDWGKALKTAMDKRGKKAELKLFEGVGHDLPREHPEEVFGLILDFFKRHLG